MTHASPAAGFFLLLSPHAPLAIPSAKQPNNSQRLVAFSARFLAVIRTSSPAITRGRRYHDRDRTQTGRCGSALETDRFRLLSDRLVRAATLRCAAGGKMK